MKYRISSIGTGLLYDYGDNVKLHRPVNFFKFLTDNMMFPPLVKGLTHPQFPDCSLHDTFFEF